MIDGCTSKFRPTILLSGINMAILRKSTMPLGAYFIKPDIENGVLYIYD